MADSLTREEATKTFVAEIPRGGTFDAALAKLGGRRTWKTVRAAQRMKEKKRIVKIPSYALNALWDLTGGWKHPLVAANGPAEGDELARVGELAIVCVKQTIDGYREPSDRLGLAWRGRPVAVWPNQSARELYRADAYGLLRDPQRAKQAIEACRAENQPAPPQAGPTFQGLAGLRADLAAAAAHRNIQ